MSALGDPRSSSSSPVLGHVVAELAAALALVGAGLALTGSALRAVVLTIALGLVGARATLGGLLGERRLGRVRPGRATTALAWAGLTAVQLLVVAPGLRDDADLPVVTVLAGLGAIPMAAALVPALRVPGLLAGRRDDLTPGLLGGALAGGVGVLVAIGLGNVIDVGDERLAALTPYVAAGAAVLALAELLSHHRVGAGFSTTVLALVALGVAVELLVLVDDGATAVDSAVTGLVVASGIVAVGLLVATALASPRPLSVPAPHAGDGPRPVGWAVAGLVLVGAGLRVAASRPLWLDEAAGARRAAGRFPDAVALGGRADPQPPLFDGLMWVARHLAGGDDLALRLPSLLVGLLLVPAVYVTAARIYDRRVGLVAALVVAVGPGLVWLSDVARPGILAALLMTLALLTMVRAIEDGRLADWGLFGLAGAALLWSHQLAIVSVVVLHVAVGALLGRQVRSGSVGLALPRYADDSGSIGGQLELDDVPPPEPASTASTASDPYGEQVTEVLSARPARDLLVGWAVSLGITALALGVLVGQRGGFGPPELLPPLEYATRGAPGAGRSVFGLIGTGVVALFGFHPADVTSRLLALWPLSILATFVLFWRAG